MNKYNKIESKIINIEIIIVYVLNFTFLDKRLENTIIGVEMVIILF
jgi:hypothetical protein